MHPDGTSEACRRTTAARDTNGDLVCSQRTQEGGGLGKRTLILPADVGVRVKVDVGVGAVDAAGLTKEGEYYTNDAYGQSGVTLQIEVDGGVGETELRVGE